MIGMKSALALAIRCKLRQCLLCVRLTNSSNSPLAFVPVVEALDIVAGLVVVDVVFALELDATDGTESGAKRTVVREADALGLVGVSAFSKRSGGSGRSGGSRGSHASLALERSGALESSEAAHLVQGFRANLALEALHALESVEGESSLEHIKAIELFARLELLLTSELHANIETLEAIEGHVVSEFSGGVETTKALLLSET
mmetsp:Transcript_29043/g.38700  ORF Transcript_29043/g.38700 Transcript_29043/m.38700 type:complete len:203 (+) Transcript_29043:56-664(+)